MTEDMLGASATTFLVLLFAHSALHKLADFPAFTGYVADYELLPPYLVTWVSRLAVVAELTIVAGLVLPATVAWASYFAGALLALYGIAIAINLLRGRLSVECGCGAITQPLSWSLLARNTLLIAITVLSSGVRGPIGLPGVAAAVAAGLIFWITYIAADQVLANFGRTPNRPGRLSEAARKQEGR
ncbi:methylamine utilization protein MauE [Rhizobium sp. ARZ01]|uniref:MauE/DoxX family redox-associated membrane protein n=1 Tax=Rhizobium sp. ARZ01 TaxID=2769313 RepID=UPI0017817805|nr:MauE/DoxX family redox-associated membrane protein [Rhizobium sp. ARZ01]MBD9375436.1 methylamine utilization protein MauE [Rhizobium sp. ARZ01]